MEEDEKEYVGCQMKCLNVDISIKFGNFLGEICIINGINSAEFDSVLRCLSNVKPFIPAFDINNQ